METKLDAGDAAYTLYENSIIQANTRTAYHISGGQLTPGTSSTQITVAVDAGEASVGGTEVSWAAEEVVLADAGVGPSGTDQNEPRVDVVYVQSNGALSAATGEPKPYAPDTDQNGDPLTPAPMEHWTPAPDSGARIGGCVLGLVLVKPSWASAQDMSTAEIKQWKLGTGDTSQFVYGDGTDNSNTTITVDDAPFTISDPASEGADGVFRYDPDVGTFIGSPDAPVELRGKLNANGLPLSELNRLEFNSSQYNLDIYDSAGGTDTAVVGIGPDAINLNRPTDFGGNQLGAVAGVNIDGGSLSPAIDMSDVTGGQHVLWKMPDGSGATYGAQLNPADGRLINFYDFTNNDSIFTVDVATTGDTAGADLRNVEALWLNQGNARIRVDPDGDLVYIDPDGDVQNIASPGAEP